MERIEYLDRANALGIFLVYYGHLTVRLVQHHCDAALLQMHFILCAGYNVIVLANRHRNKTLDSGNGWLSMVRAFVAAATGWLILEAFFKTKGSQMSDWFPNVKVE